MNHKLSLYIYSTALVLLALQWGFCQPKNNILKDVAMPAPNAASLGKYGDIPVSYFTGVPNVSIPIYTVKNGSLSVPISLSYHAAGVKVGETASWVGLNWSLNAGGVITRSVMGIPDELLQRGYLACASRLLPPLQPNSLPASAQADSIASGQLDSEPDMYTFNVAGYSGKFTFDGEKKVHFIPKADFKLEYFTNSYSNGLQEFIRFILTAPDGTRYIFGTLPSPDPISGIEYQTFDNSANNNKAPSSWYLVAVESQDLNSRIRLEYAEEIYSYQSLSSWTNDNGTWEAGGIGIASYKKVNNNYINGRRLVAIHSPTAIVKFVAGPTARTDLEGSAYPLSKIEIRNGQTVDTCYNTFELFTSYYTSSGGSTSAYKRLRLDSLREKSCSGTIVNPAYKLEYHPGDIPNRFSYAIDHWGFANGANGNDNTYNVPANGIPPNPPAYVLASAQRESSYTPMVVGTLKKITYPTGGHTEFTFEANKVSNTSYNSVTQTVEITKYELTSCNLPPPSTACCNSNITVYKTFTSQDLGVNSNSELQSQIYLRLDMMNILNYSGNPGGFKYCTPNGGPINSNPVWVKIEIRKASNNDPVFIHEYNINVTDGSGTWPQYPVLASSFELNVQYKIVLQTLNSRASFKMYRFETVTTGGSTTEVQEVGGLRIKEMKHHDGRSSSNDVVKRYHYTQSFGSTDLSGILYYRPVYHGIVTLEGGYIVDPYSIFFSTSVTPLGAFHGYHVGYSKVWEENVGGGGRTRHDFTQAYSLYTSGLNPAYPIPPAEAQLSFGQEIAQFQYNDGGTEQAKTETQYKNVNYNYLPGRIFKIHRRGSPGTYNYAKMEYQIRTASVLVSQKTEIVDGVSTTTQMQYDAGGRHLAPTSITFTNSDNKVTTTTHEYIHDLPSTQDVLREELLKRNIIAQPFRTTVSVDGLQTGGSRLDYALYNSGTGLPNLSPGTATGHHPYPYQFWNFEMTWDHNNSAQVTGWVLKGTIDSYHGSSTNGKGNPKQVTQANWLPETYEWQNNLLTQKTYQQHTQTYTYKTGTSLVASATAIDGQVINYTYDRLQRLKTVSARGGNVVTTYTYNFRTSAYPYNSVKSSTVLTSVSGSFMTSKATTQLTDGLGRPIQDIKIQHHPTKGQDGATYGAVDVVVNYDYDVLGRMYRQSLPYASPNTNGNYYAPPGGTKYTVSTFEASPLSRTLTVTPPDWYATSSAYGTNAANEVLIPGTSNYYAAGTLRKTTLTDPDNRVSITYTDKKGRLILKRQTDTGNTSPADTYYQYDLKDRVIRVMPPGVSASTTSLVFAYQYDGADRMTRKKVPDMGSISMRYNNRDQLVFVQDSMQKYATTSRCLGTKYDNYGRPIESGFVDNFPTDPNAAFSFSEVLSKTWYDGYDGYTQVNLTTFPQYRGKVRKTETKILDANNTWLYKVIFYDRYGRDSLINGNNHLNLGSSTAESVAMTYDWADNVMTENRTHTPGSAGATGTFSINNSYRYDHAGRRMDFITTIGGIGQHVAEYNYNHRDELIEKNLHANEAPNYPGGPLVWSWLQSIDYSYNAQGWLTGINNWNPSATINTPALCTPAMPNPASPGRSTYNEASDLFMLDLRYDQPATGISGLTAAPAQKAGNISQIVYRVRGRESSIISYSYDYLSRLSTSTFHNYSDAGVISGTNNYNENLTYDLRGNIQTLQRTGFYQNGGTCTYGQIDNLSYSYTSNTNRLHKVLDATTTAGDAKSRGFNGNLSTADNSMTYDRNGNLNKNLHKNVSTITYNHLNLPTVITFTTGNTIEFLYDAAGMKLRKTVKVGATVQYVQDYLPGGIEYRQNGTGVKRVESVFHAEGRYYNTNVDASNTISWRREYNIKDHLGNTRLVFTDRNANGVVDITGTASTSDVLQENHYYAFGLPFEGAWLMNDAAARDNKYQYNGKEFNDDFGLNWNDYGARWYDASVGRWNAVDPLAYIYYGFSPYNYTINNPILLIDPDGRIVVFRGNAQQQSRLQNSINQYFGVGDLFQIDNYGQLSVNELSEEQQKKLSKEQLSAYNEIRGLSNAAFEVRFDLVDENTSWSQSDEISGKDIFGDDYPLGIMDVGDLSKMGGDVGRALVHMLHEQAIGDNPAIFNPDRSAQRMGYTEAHKRAMANDLRKIGWTYKNDIHGNVNGNYVVYRDAVDSEGKILRSTKITMVSKDNQTILKYENVNRNDSQNQQIIRENNFTKMDGN